MVSPGASSYHHYEDIENNNHNHQPNQPNPNRVHSHQEDASGNVKATSSEKIPFPFIIVNTHAKAVIQCEMCPERRDVSFDFSAPFEINDDNEILKRLGM